MNCNAFDNMNIVYVTDNYWPRMSGMAVSIDSFCRELKKKGIDVHILAPDYPNAKEHDAMHKDINIHRFKSLKIFFSKEDRCVSPFQERKISDVMNSIDPAIIHIQTEFNMGRIAIKYAIENNIPLIATAHTVWREYAFYIPILPGFFRNSFVSYYYRKFYMNIDNIVVPSKAMKLYIETYVQNKNISIIPTGICPEEFSGIRKRGKVVESYLGMTHSELADKDILLYVGRVSIEKNIPFLIDVMKEVLPHKPDLLFIIVGDGPFRETLKQIVQDENLEQSVKFTGYIGREYIRYMYSIAKIFVFASKTESQGLSVLESMICGTPVVSIGVMGILDTMKDNKGGFMVEDDVDLFAGKIVELLNDDILYRKKSEEALEYSKEWTIEKRVVKMVQQYYNLIT
ncbi:MAG: glycosyltransferase [Spirochaetaceae bacterium]|nr:glycosyltransferase [Spirochaetaceae bacterium]